MDEPKLQIVLQRRDCTGNIARFYMLAIEPSLYGMPCLFARGGGSVRSAGSALIFMVRPAKPARRSRLGWHARRGGVTCR